MYINSEGRNGKSFNLCKKAYSYSQVVKSIESLSSIELLVFDLLVVLYDSALGLLNYNS
ncbi:hypothetical protein D3C74_487230 [compost metagenome]